MGNDYNRIVKGQKGSKRYLTGSQLLQSLTDFTRGMKIVDSIIAYI